jgi:hypothetical protein
MRRSTGALLELEAARFATAALSVYLPVDRRPLDARLLLRSVAGAEIEALRLPDGVRPPPGLGAELDAVADRLQGLHFDCPAIAVFSHAGTGFFRLWRLAFPLRARLRYRRRLDLDPLREQLQRRPPALVVVADKEGARMLSVVLGEVAELGRMAGAPVSRHKQGGWMAARLQRREDAHAHANLAAVAAATSRILGGGFYRSLHLDGPPEARAHLARQLDATAGAALAREIAKSTPRSGSCLAATVRRTRERPGEHKEVRHGA